MSLWADYMWERLGRSVLERDDGFVIYYDIEWNGEKAVYIQEIYVRPECRKKGLAAEMADGIAEDAISRDIFTLIGSVEPSTEGANSSLRVLLAYGFTVACIDARNNLIMFKKSLGD